MKLFTNLKQRHGFSLAELIIYLGILGISAGIFGGMLNTITSTQVDQFNQNEVSGQLNFAVQTMQRYIRDASIIQGNSGDASSTLVLQMPVSAQNPTTFYLQNNKIYLQQGATGTPQAITNDKVSVDSLVFKKFAQPAAKDVVQIDIAISQTQPNGTKIDRSLRSAVTRVNAAAFDSDLIPNVDASYNIGTYPSARWLNGSFSGQVSAGSLCFGADCRTSWAQASGVTGSGSANYIAKWNTASTINASTLLYDNGTNVGIGAINPSYKLDVQGGQINTSGGLCINGDCKTAWSQVTGTNYWTATGTSIYYSTGNVGVGTASPGTKLDVSGGDIRTSGTLTVGYGASSAQIGGPGSAHIWFPYTDGTVYFDSDNGFNFRGLGGTSLTYIGSNGNVGLGTTAPAAKLQVASSTNTEGVRIISSNYSPFVIRNSADTADLFRVDQNGNVTGGTGNASAWTRDATNGYLYNSTLTDKVGIGTASPVTSLTVNSPSASSWAVRFRNGSANRYRNDYSIDSSGLTINAYDDGVAAYMPIRLDGSTFQLRVNGGNTNTLYLDGSGNVGIGTVSQDAKLQVAGNGTGFARIGADCGNNYTAIGLNGAFSNCSNYSMLGGDGNLFINRPTGGSMYFRENNATQLTIASGSGNATFTGAVTASAFSGGSYAGTISSANVSSGSFGANTGGGNYSFPGNVGIGTASPSQKLEINGNLKFTGTNASLLMSDNSTAGLWVTNPGAGQIFLGTTYDWDQQAAFIYTPGTVGAGAGLLQIGQISKNNANFTHGTTAFYTNGAERMRINSSGNVGIGTTAPGYKLEVNGNGKIGGLTLQASDPGNVPALWTNTSAVYLQSASGDWATADYTRGNGLLVGGGGGTGDLTIAGVFHGNGAGNSYFTGNVGIGTTAPANKLSVSGQSDMTSLSVGTSTAQTAGNGYFTGTVTAGAFAGGTYAGTINAANVSSGNFGANTGGGDYSFPGNITLSPVNPYIYTGGSYLVIPNGLYVSGGTPYFQTSIKARGGVHNDTGAYLELDGGTSGYTYVNGSLGVGTASPGAKLEVSGVDNYTNGIILSANASYRNLITSFFDGANPTTGSALQFKVANDSVGGNTAVMTLKGSGNVGIGTSAPANKLSVNGQGDLVSLSVGTSTAQTAGNGYFTGTVTAGAFAGGTYAGTISSANVSSGTFGSNTGGGTYSFSGNVGIGTTAPANKLSVSGQADMTSLSVGTSTAQTAGNGYFTGTVTAGAFAGGTYAGTINAANVSSGQFGSNTGGGIYSFSGNVGIGTTGPGEKIDVFNGNIRTTNTGNAYVAINSGAASTPYISFQRGGIEKWEIGPAAGGVTGDGFALYGGTSPSVKMTVDMSGNVGIGTTGPAMLLDIYGVDKRMRIGDGTNQLVLGQWDSATNRIESAGRSLRLTTYAGSINLGISGADNLVVANSGNVGIGTTSPAHKLDVNGSFYSELVVKGNCTGAVTIDWNAGNTQHCVLTGNVTFTFSNGQSGGNYKLVLKQGGTGSYTITWPASVRWGSGVAPTLTTTVGKTDYAGFFYNGVDSTYDGNAFNANF